MSHPSRYQYQTKSDLDKKLYIQDAIDTFVFASYIRKAAPTDQAASNLGSAWEDIESPIVTDPTPLGIADQADGRISFNFPGVYFLSVTGAFEHNSLPNDARKTYFRTYNYTTSIPDPNPLVIPTGRNAEATSINLSDLFTISETEVGQILGFQMGGGDTYTSTIINTFSYSIFNVGLWQLPLG